MGLLHSVQVRMALAFCAAYKELSYSISALVTDFSALVTDFSALVTDLSALVAGFVAGFFDCFAFETSHGMSFSVVSVPFTSAYFLKCFPSSDITGSGNH